MKDFKYKSIFAGHITKIVNEDMDKYISKAGLEKLRPLLPESINLDNNPDFIAIVLNCAVAGRSNANGDAITNETAIQVSKSFINKYCNIEHSRDKVKGVIVNYGFSKFGSNELLTEEEAKASKDPFNISLAVLLWKLTLNDEFIDLLESSTDNTSSKYNSISASWELLFNDYDIGVGTKNLNESEIITDESQKKELEKYLQAEGGVGRKDNKIIYRVIKGETLVPAGIGLVETPAAEVKGLEIIDNKQQTQDKNMEKSNSSEDMVCPNCGETMDEENDESMDNEESEMTCAKCGKKSMKANWKNSKKTQANFTKEKNSVIEIKSKNNIMDKITKITDLNDENLKECKASTVIELFNESLKEADKKWKEQEELTKNAQAEKLKVEANLIKIQEDLKKLQDIQAAKEAEEIYTQRMTYFDDTYELSKEERQAIASDVKDADQDSFEKAKAKYDIFLKDKSKAAIKEKQDLEEAEAKKSGKVFDKEKKKWVNKDEMKDDKKEDKKESKASLDENGNVIDEALANGKAVNTPLPNAQSGEQTLEAKYAEAFKLENCIEVSKR